MANFHHLGIGHPSRATRARVLPSQTSRRRPDTGLLTSPRRPSLGRFHPSSHTERLAEIVLRHCPDSGGSPLSSYCPARPREKLDRLVESRCSADHRSPSTLTRIPKFI